MYNKRLHEIYFSVVMDNLDLGEKLDMFKVSQEYGKAVLEEVLALVIPNTTHRTFPSDYIAGEEGVELLDATVEKIKKHFGV